MQLVLKAREGFPLPGFELEAGGLARGSEGVNCLNDVMFIIFSDFSGILTRLLSASCFL